MKIGLYGRTITILLLCSVFLFLQTLGCEEKNHNESNAVPRLFSPFTADQFKKKIRKGMTRKECIKIVGGIPVVMLNKTLLQVKLQDADVVLRFDGNDVLTEIEMTKTQKKNPVSVSKE